MRRHRIFLVPTRSDIGLDAAIDHWEQQHGEVFAATPHLDGYVQHQPTRADQVRLGGRVCAEAWFADRDAERSAFDSAHYRGAVTDDEDRFVDRSRAWSACVVHDEHPGDVTGPVNRAIEVVAIGCDPALLPSGLPARVLHVDRPGPGGGHAAVVVAAVADVASGRALADGLVADVSFVARCAAVRPPVT